MCTKTNIYADIFTFRPTSCFSFPVSHHTVSVCCNFTLVFSLLARDQIDFPVETCFPFNILFVSGIYYFAMNSKTFLCHMLTEDSGK